MNDLSASAFDTDTAFKNDACETSAAAIPTVLHVFRYFRPDFTGEGLYFEKLAPWLGRCGFRSRVFVTATRAPLASLNIPDADTPYYAATGRAARLRAFLAAARDADLVHFHCMVDRLFLPHVAARLAGRPVVQSSTLDDGLGMIVDGYRAAYRPLVRRLCHTVGAAVAISPLLAEDSRRVFAPARVHLIPQGVAVPRRFDPAEREATRAALGYGPEDVVLLYVGSLTPRKNPGFLVRHHPADLGGRARLLLVGPNLDDAHAAQVLAEMQAAPHAAAMTRLPFQEDPGPFFRSADIFVFASNQEGFGNVLLEAMAAGLPIVARRLAGVTDSFIQDGRTGFLFDDAAGYDRIIRMLIGDPARRRAIGEAAAADVRARFGLDRIAGRYAQLYRSLLSPNAARKTVP